MSALEQIDGGFVTHFDRMEEGRPLGSKRGMVTVKCPKCGCIAWMKTAREYVHRSKTTLNRKNEPQIESTWACELTKHEAERVASGKPIGVNDGR
jgi:hypothetical protein